MTEAIPLFYSRVVATVQCRELSRMAFDAALTEALGAGKGWAHPELRQGTDAGYAMLGFG